MSDTKSEDDTKKITRCRVTLLHLDLGIGGAERLVVDAASQLRERGFPVKVFTTHHDKSHCFRETLQSGSEGLRDVIEVYGDWIPRYIDVGFLTGKTSDRRFVAFCGILRMIFLSLVFIVLHVFSVWAIDDCDAHVVIMDGISAPIPILAIFGFPVFFYCHFPDKFLSPINTESSETASKGISSALKRCYRDVVDILEDISMSQASLVAVNSKFTAGVCTDCFSFLRTNYGAGRLEIIYPAVDCDSDVCEDDGDEPASIVKPQKETVSTDYCDGFDDIFISLNRYEKKKKLELAIHSFYHLVESIKLRKRRKDPNLLLVIAGGYDPAVEENIEYFKELVQLAKDLELSDNIVFRRSISNEERLILLRRSTALLYTPDREHFGIVPIEAMALGTAVVAVASGGPLETIVHGHTGFLVSQTKESFATAMEQLLLPDEESRTEKRADVMGRRGRLRVKEHFSKKALGEKLQKCVLRVATQSPGIMFFTAWIVVLVMVGQGIGYIIKWVVHKLADFL